MDQLDLSTVPEDIRPISSWASALLVALARDEVAGRRKPPCLTEPGLTTWTRFRGRLTANDLVEILFEDAAVLHRVPFDPAAVDSSLRVDRLPTATIEAWLASLPGLDLGSPGADYMAGQAKRLGLPTRLARSELRVVKPHQKVLELPGTGGQLAHHLVSTQQGITLQDNFVVACSTWQEMALAGLAALDRGAPNSDFVSRVDLKGLRELEHPLRQRSFDFVVGLHPDKGGLFQINNQLAIWFPSATILLV